jgi:hypothetical protein
MTLVISTRRKPQPRVALLSALTLLLGSSGCASISYVDSHKNRHVIGFVDITTPSSDGTPAQPATSAVTLTTFGLALYRRPDSNSGITLGYNKETLVSLPNNACLNLDDSSICAPAKPDTKGTAEQ